MQTNTALRETQQQEALVVVSDLCVRFNSKPVLSGVGLTLYPKEIVTLIGPNGAGKSTLVRAILGLLKPDRGAISLRPNLRLGYVPQRLTVDPVLPMTVRRFLALPWPQPIGARRAVLKDVNAGDLMDRAVQDLSGGEFQRIVLARALLREPELLVLDEPLQGIDFTGQIEFYDLIKKLRDERDMGVLMVSHDLHVVMAATDRVICLNNHVCCSGAPESVSRHPEYTALFGPMAERGFAIYTHEHDHHHDMHGDVVAHADHQVENQETVKRCQNK